MGMRIENKLSYEWNCLTRI